MEFNEQEIKQNWQSLRNKSFKDIEMILSNIDFDMQTMIGSFVASICQVDYADLHSANNNQEVIHARWLYWFALRWWSNESYEVISKRTMLDGCRFSGSNIGIGISKMAQMTSQRGMWKDRFAVIKKFISLKDDPMSYKVSDFCNPMPQKYLLSLRVPKGMKNNINIEVKEEEK